MIPTVTESVLDAEQPSRVESFLAGFLPRMREAPGAIEILHDADRESAAPRRWSCGGARPTCAPTARASP